ncbi:hypothetical protein GCM10009764_60000 [Nocardia ninae]|uniref:Ricin B lectin domain-containing protein n=1 Tax=Nocardia ninae NBRC 108245 TaxID=1210091 RepID=A0A511MLH2_9NOCA|nr:hypothetical protein NN4_55060 [Nocardia ninae NBRC 108245]
MSSGGRPVGPQVSPAGAGNAHAARVDEAKLVSLGCSRTECMDLKNYNTGTPVTLEGCDHSTNGSNKWGRAY